MLNIIKKISFCLSHALSLAVALLLLSGICTTTWAQSIKPQRSAAPTFQPGQFDGIFFDDPASQLRGQMPSAASQPTTAIAGADKASAARDEPRGATAVAWKELISPTSLEDLVKGSKLRLDKIVTTPTAFKGGGFVQARTEFSLQAALFAIIQSYPAEVRWKSSAAEAGQRFARVAANTKVGSDQVFSEAQARLLDLSDLLGGTPLATGSPAAASDIEWSNLIDRVPLMQLLEWAYAENLTKLVANAGDFEDNSEAVQRYAELIAVLGQVAVAEEMPDASDGDYQALASAMIQPASQIVLAVQTNNAELARTAAAQVGQACSKCHDSFR